MATSFRGWCWECVNHQCEPGQLPCSECHLPTPPTGYVARFSTPSPAGTAPVAPNLTPEDEEVLDEMVESQRAAAIDEMARENGGDDMGGDDDEQNGKST